MLFFAKATVIVCQSSFLLSYEINDWYVSTWCWLENYPRLWMEVPLTAFRPLTWPPIPEELRAWSIHMPKIKVRGHSVQTDGRMDGGHCIVSAVQRWSVKYWSSEYSAQPCWLWTCARSVVCRSTAVVRSSHVASVRRRLHSSAAASAAIAVCSDQSRALVITYTISSHAPLFFSQQHVLFCRISHRRCWLNCLLSTV